MAAITFGTMQTRVGELINQSVSDDAKTVTNTEVKANLNLGYNKAVNAVVAANEDYYIRESKADLVASQQSYSLPDDAKKLVRLNVAYATTSPMEYYKATKLDIHSWPEPTSNVYSTTDCVYAVISDGFLLNPTPSDAITDGLQLFYIEDIGDMTNTSDTPSLPRGFHHLPIMYAVAKAHVKLGNMNEANMAMAEFETDLIRMQDEIIARTGSDVDYVEVTDMMPEV